MDLVWTPVPTNGALRSHTVVHPGCFCSQVQQQQQQQQQEEEAGKGSVRYSAKCKGQTVAAIIGAYAHNSFPFLLDLTDGEVHHILQLQGSELVAWTGLTPTQVWLAGCG
jgi:hypothetical protein